MTFILFQIIKFPLHQQWNVDLYGRIAMAILFKKGGQLVKLLFNGAGSIGHASLGGA